MIIQLFLLFLTCYVLPDPKKNGLRDGRNYISKVERLEAYNLRQANWISKNNRKSHCDIAFLNVRVWWFLLVKESFFYTELKPVFLDKG